LRAQKGARRFDLISLCAQMNVLGLRFLKGRGYNARLFGGGVFALPVLFVHLSANRSGR
jgi:hypothetical protein